MSHQLEATSSDSQTMTLPIFLTTCQQSSISWMQRVSAGQPTRKTCLRTDTRATISPILMVIRTTYASTIRWPSMIRLARIPRVPRALGTSTISLLMYCHLVVSVNSTDRIRVIQVGNNTLSQWIFVTPNLRKWVAIVYKCLVLTRSQRCT